MTSLRLFSLCAAIPSGRALDGALVPSHALSTLENVANTTPDPPLLDAQQAACDELLPGSREDDYGTVQGLVNGATSDRELVFNLGGYKTGSSSVNDAMKKLGLHTCKTAWGDAGGGSDSFRLESIASFLANPVEGDSPLHNATRVSVVPLRFPPASHLRYTCVTLASAGLVCSRPSAPPLW
jgi:hypothetical protein